MNISCTQENLSKGVSAVSRVVGTRGTLPILSHVLLSTDKGRLRIAGTDLEVGIICYIGAKIESEGAVTVPARLLGEFISANHDETIQLEADGTKIKASSEHVTAHLNGLSATDFPLIPEVDPKNSITIKASDFKEAISQVVFAAALDESRPILTGVSIIAKDKKMVVAATDSYRLAERVIDLENAVKEEITVIVPGRTLQEVGRLIEAGAKEVTIAVAQNQISFSFDTITIVSRVLEGTFPDYEQIIPKEKKTTVTISTNELQNALKLGSSFARDVANNIRLVVEEGQSLQVIATSPQVGDTTAQVDAETNGEKLEIAFNAKFLIDVLANSGTSKAQINFNGSLSPAIVIPTDKKNYRALVMPLRLDESA